MIINIGIFLSIFAATSAGITYYIEKKINNIEFDLITNQKDLKNSSKNISLFQKIIIDMDLLKRVEDKEFTNLIFIKSLKYGEKIISNKDLYLPYIYLAIKDLVLLEKLFDELLQLKSQVWYTGVSKELFKSISEQTVFFEVKNNI